MSLMQTCAEVEAKVARARALFGSGHTVDVPDAGSRLTQAVQSVSAARSRTTGLAGAGVRGYQSMADRSVTPLTTAAGSDTALAAHAAAVAVVTQTGAARTDHIAATTRTITHAAPMATSAGDQRVILTALRSQLSRASQVVRSTQEQAGVLSRQLRESHYPKDTPAQALDHEYEHPLSPPPPAPPWVSPPEDSILVWYVPSIFGGFDCTAHYPDGSWWRYESPVDESGVINHWPYWEEDDDG